MVRIWLVAPRFLCRERLLGIHRELHTALTALSRGGGGYFNHPEVQKFLDYPGSLVALHGAVVQEMRARGYKHHSPPPEFVSLSGGFLPTPQDIVRDYEDLQQRWQKEGKLNQLRSPGIAVIVSESLQMWQHCSAVDQVFVQEGEWVEGVVV